MAVPLGPGPGPQAGLGLRAPHVSRFLAETPPVPWLEVLADNYLDVPEGARQRLDRIADGYPLTFHGVGLSLGSVDPLDRDHLRALRKLADRYQPAWISEHLCWSGAGGRFAHELLPLPYTEEAVGHVAARVQEVQNELGQRLVLENLSSYVTFTASEMTEWEFLSEVSRRADCEILLDLNNVYVSAFNHGLDPTDYLAGIPPQRIREIHLGGYTHQGTHLLDSHGARVQPPVWDLFKRALRRFGARPTLIEWDTDIPELEVLLDETGAAQQLIEEETAHA